MDAPGALDPDGIIILSLALLRPFKATLIALQYQRRAGEDARASMTLGTRRAAPFRLRLLGGFIATLMLGADPALWIRLLGIWQLDRLAWKESLIAQVNARLTQPPLRTARRPTQWAAGLDLFDATPITIR